MKQTVIKALVAAMVVLMPLMSGAQNTQYYQQRTLVLSNDTRSEVDVAYAYFDNGTNYWTSVGWIQIAAYSKSSITIGAATAPTFYVHAQNAQGNIWGGDYYYCANTNAFNIPYADQNGCGTKVRFRPIVLNDVGETYYSFHH